MAPVDDLKLTPIDEIPHIVSNLRQTFNTGKTKPQSFRQAQLERLLEFLETNRDAIDESLAQDLRKPAFESYIGEYVAIKNDIIEAIEELENWMAPRVVKKPLMVLMDKATVVPEPFGVVLIIGAWNFPFMETLKPLVGAIAAGNCVVVKPSELSISSSNLLARLVPKYLDPTCFQVITGGVEETTTLLKEKFDHILYTGNSSVGKIVMRAAAEHLSPVTLELGGKSPAIVDSTANIGVSARRIIWGKFLNAGQVCIAPDYVICLESIHDELVSEIKKGIVEFYGSDASVSPHYSRIVNLRHFQRLKAIINADSSNEDDAKKSTRQPCDVIVCGGEMDEDNLYIAPTVIDHATVDSPSMKEEIFGPVLPIITVASLSEAIGIVQSRAKPLALYLFSRDSQAIARVKDETSSGAITVNDTIMHAGVSTLPFGGIGESGMGCYGGKSSFETFSHEKPVLERSFIGARFDSLRFPPYTESQRGWFKWIAERSLTTWKSRLGFWIIIGVASLGWSYYKQNHLIGSVVRSVSIGKIPTAPLVPKQ